MIDLGSELQQAREKKGVSLSEAESATRIKECYLQALEVDDWAALPTQVQARGFLRNYAVYLGLGLLPFVVLTHSPEELSNGLVRNRKE